MKLTHNIANKPYKTIGIASRAYQTPDRQPNSLYIAGSDKRQPYTQPQVYSSRNSTVKVCPYENNLVFSQVNDRISQFSNGYMQGKSTELYANNKRHNDSGMNKKEYSLEKQHYNWSQLLGKLKMQIMEQVNAIIKQHRAQTAKSLKQAIVKVDQGIKKECTIQFSRQFLPISYLDDSQIQIQQLHRGLKTLENSVAVKNQRQAYIEEEQRYLLVQITNIKDKIKNMELKIQSSQRTSRINQDKYMSNKEELDKRIKETLSVESEVLNQIMKIKLQLKNMSEVHDSALNRIKQLQLIPKSKIQQVNQTNQTRKSQINQQMFLQVPHRTSGIQNRTSLQMEKNGQSILPGKSLSLTFSLQSIGDLSSPKMKDPVLSSIKSLKHIKSTKYILDNDNNLMDDTGNYILDDAGQLVKLTSQQILILKESNIVKYVQI